MTDDRVDLPDKYDAVVREAITNIAIDLLNDIKNETPQVHHTERCSTEPHTEWIDGETVDLEDWR